VITNILEEDTASIFMVLKMEADEISVLMAASVKMTNPSGILRCVVLVEVD
jgi:hypothetical protein